MALRSRWFSAWILILVAFTAAPVIAQDTDRDISVGEKGEAITKLVQTAGQSVGFSGAVLAARDGRVIAACATGFADLSKQQPLTSTTLFEICSVSKPFTAIALCKIAEQGKLDLDDPISRYLPDIPEDCQAITVRHLLQHTSGIPGENDEGWGDDVTAVIPLFLKGGPRTEPGTKWEYWNQGYSLVTEVGARASGRSYVDFCRDEIFQPAGMHSTCFTGDLPPEGAVVAVGTSAYGRPRSALAHPYGSYGFQYRGMGGIVTNVWDLWRWDRALRENRILSGEMKKELFTAGPGGYGLGWHVGANRHRQRFQMHDGSVRGFVCDVRRYQDDDACIFVLCNRDNCQMHHVMNAVEQILFDRAVEPGIPDPVDPSLRDQLVGTYVNYRKQSLIIEKQGSSMAARIEWGGPVVTLGFLGTGSDERLIFCEGADNTEVHIKRNDQGVVRSVRLGTSVFRRRE